MRRVLLIDLEEGTKGSSLKEGESIQIEKVLSKSEVRVLKGKPSRKGVQDYGPFVLYSNDHPQTYVPPDPMLEIEGSSRNRCLGFLHDLRDVVGCIRNYSAWLSADSKASGPLATIVDRIRWNTDILVTLFDSLTEELCNRPTVMNTHINEIHLPQGLELLLESYKLQAREKGLELRTTFRGNLPKRILTDEIRVRQVISNLVGNALKFTFQGTIEVDIWYSDGKLNILVTDSGIGIPKAIRTKIFSPFYRAPESKTLPGTGLGLSLARKAAQRLGGDVVLVRSETQQGSVFHATVSVEIPKNICLTEKGDASAQ